MGFKSLPDTRSPNVHGADPPGPPAQQRQCAVVRRGDPRGEVASAAMSQAGGYSKLAGITRGG